MHKRWKTWFPIVGLFLLSLGLGWWVRTQDPRWPAGDEPNYAIMTEALVRHGSFDLKPVFNSQDYVGTFYGEPVGPQLNDQYFSTTSPQWYSIHSFGLPLLAAPFLAGAYALHAKPLDGLILGMAVYGALTVMAAYLYCLELTKRRGVSLLAALVLLGSLSFLSLTGSLFPDLPTAGLLALSLLCIAKLRHQPRRWYWYAIAGVAASFMVYLHVKSGLAAATIVGLLLLQWWRTDKNRAHLAWLLGPPVVMGTIYAVKIHQWYHTWVVTAPFGNGQLFHFTPGLSILASWLDTTKGLIPNNPAYLLILAGLVPWWKRDRRSLLTMVVVLLPSLLLQSTFNDWAGGYSPIGRYMMPLVVALLPAVAYVAIYARDWLARLGLGLLLGVQVWLGWRYVVGRYQWNYAGEANPLFVALRQTYHVRHDVSSALFGYNLELTRRGGLELLALEGAVCLAALLVGVLLVRRRASHSA
ncbi:MAG TPA: phospholipid carrier-dependent glycosyltransferase [Candidatus Saccharimonadia bacterium]|nr:phospholipid carrier-dependent glycosyltransferase [Candidatus Saccharimonadia bacterium]